MCSSHERKQWEKKPWEKHRSDTPRPGNEVEEKDWLQLPFPMPWTAWWRERQKKQEKRGKCPPKGGFSFGFISHYPILLLIPNKLISLKFVLPMMVTAEWPMSFFILFLPPVLLRRKWREQVSGAQSRSTHQKVNEKEREITNVSVISTVSYNERVSYDI